MIALCEDTVVAVVLLLEWSWSLGRNREGPRKGTHGPHDGRVGIHQLASSGTSCGPSSPVSGRHGSPSEPSTPEGPRGGRRVKSYDPPVPVGDRDPGVRRERRVSPVLAPRDVTEPRWGLLVRVSPRLLGRRRQPVLGRGHLTLRTTVHSRRRRSFPDHGSPTLTRKQGECPGVGRHPGRDGVL